MIRLHDSEDGRADALFAHFSDSRESPERLLKRLDKDLHRRRTVKLPRLRPGSARPVLMAAGIAVLVLGLFAASRMADPVDVDNITLDKLWEYKTLAPVISSPAVGDIDNDGANEVLITSTDGKFYALEGTAGKRIFFFETWHPVTSSPVLSGPNRKERWLVFAGEDRRVYTLSGSGRCLWATIPQTIDTPVISSPALLRINADAVPDVVVAGEDGKLYGLDGNRGWLLWRSQETTGKFFSTPLAVRMNDDVTPDLIIGSPDRRVYGIDGRTGQKIWETAVPGAVNSSAVLLDETTAIVADEEGWVSLLDVRTGRIKAKTCLGSSVISSPALLNRSVKPLICVPLKDGTIRALDASTLKNVWTSDTGYQDAFVATPAVFDLNNDRCDDIVVTSRNGNCYALNGRDGRSLCDPFFCGNSVSSSPALADLNNDGFLDIVFGSENGSVYAVSVKTAPDRLVKRNRIVHGSFLDRGAQL
jgi:outer membrane protein assembly factor BamB